MKNIIRKIAQSYADFIIERLQTAQSDEHFENWYIQGLYLDLWCEQRGIELN